MGIFGTSKVTRLLHRLFGRSNAECMNVLSGSGGLIADMRDSINDLSYKVSDLNQKVEALTPKAVNKPTKVRTTKKK